MTAIASWFGALSRSHGRQAHAGGGGGVLHGRQGTEKKQGELWEKSQPHYPKDRAPCAVPPPLLVIERDALCPTEKLKSSRRKNTVILSTCWLGVGPPLLQICHTHVMCATDAAFGRRFDCALTWRYSLHRSVHVVLTFKIDYDIRFLPCALPSVLCRPATSLMYIYFSVAEILHHPCQHFACLFRGR